MADVGGADGKASPPDGWAGVTRETCCWADDSFHQQKPPRPRVTENREVSGGYENAQCLRNESWEQEGCRTCYWRVIRRPKVLAMPLSGCPSQPLVDWSFSLSVVCNEAGCGDEALRYTLLQVYGFLFIFSRTFFEDIRIANIYISYFMFSFRFTFSENVI